MNYFTQLTNLPIHDLYKEMNEIMTRHNMKWDNGTQICINHIFENSDDVLFGVGSLSHDWDKSYIIKSQTGEKKIIVPLRNDILQEHDFVHLCTQFKGTLFEEIYIKLKQHYQIGRVRIMMSKPKTCLSWHEDDTTRIHYPIKTHSDCFMIIEDQVKHLPANTWWMTNTMVKHTAMNASLEDRMHLVAVVLS